MEEFIWIDWNLQKIGLKLHEEIVFARPAIHAQFLQPNFCIGLHCLEHVENLEGNSFQCRAGNMRR